MDYHQIEQETLDWVNLCRTQPQSIIPELQAIVKRYQGNSYKDPESQVSIITSEVNHLAFNP